MNRRNAFLSIVIIVVIVLAGVLVITRIAGGPGAPATPANALSLNATYSGADEVGGTLTFNHPQDWVTQPDRPGAVATRAEVFDLLPGEPFAEDMAAVLVSAIPRDLASLVVGENVTVMAIALAFLENADSSGVVFGQPAAYALGDKVGVRSQGTGQEGDALLLVIEEEEAFIFLSGITARGQMSAYQATFEAIVASVIYEGISVPEGQ